MYNTHTKFCENKMVHYVAQDSLKLLMGHVKSFKIVKFVEDLTREQ